MSLNIQDIHSVISTNIIRIRRERAMTQEDLGNQIQSSQAFVHQIETGHKHCNLEQIYKIATVLGCSIYDIIPDNQITWSQK